MIKTGKVSVGILGGGMQGSCMALLFRKKGYEVTILEQADDLMSRASFNQEGKIHMGFIYAHDTSMNTGHKLMRDCLHFASCLEELLDEKINWNQIKSDKFMYLVPKDSITDAMEIKRYFGKLQSEYEKIMRSYPHLSYLGERPEKIYESVPLPGFAEASQFANSFQTEEVAVSQNILRERVRKKLTGQQIKICLNTKVLGCKKLSACAYEVNTTKGDHSFDYVVNCLWENQAMLDAQLGVNQKTNINLRLKFGLVSSHIDALDTLPSFSMITGAYGDFVNFTNTIDRQMYFSWYPVSRYGMLVNQAIPQEWNNICNGIIPEELYSSQIKDQLKAYQNLFKTEFNFNSPKLIPGIIVAKGLADIDDDQTELHTRDEDPVFYSEGYFSISTGKFTSIPYNTHVASTYLN